MDVVGAEVDCAEIVEAWNCEVWGDNRARNWEGLSAMPSWYFFML